MKLPELKYDEKGLIPAIVQDAESREVLMMAYMNAESLAKTVESGFTHFWSRSRGKFWKKGETSGHVQEVREVLYDCDRDTLLIKVIQRGPGACHTGHRSCFFTDIEGKETEGKVFSEDEVYGRK
jgi:phosphoribosyl-AMP cyclohydrolase